MIVGSREEVLAGLAVLGAQACQYSIDEKWAERCDCKYGICSPVGMWYSERTGCPELRAAHAIISMMTESEWKTLAGEVAAAPHIGAHAGRFSCSTPNISG